MKQIFLLIALTMLPIAGFSQAEKGYIPAYNPSSSEVYRPPKPEDIPAGYRYIKPLITLIMNVDTTSRPATTFTLYPNPAKDYVELHWDWFAQGLDGALSLSIYSLDGKLLYREVEDDYAKNVWLIKTDGLHTGMYVMEVQNVASEVIFTEKLNIVK